MTSSSYHPPQVHYSQTKMQAISGSSHALPTATTAQKYKHKFVNTSSVNLLQSTPKQHHPTSDMSVHLGHHSRSRSTTLAHSTKLLTPLHASTLPTQPSDSYTAVELIKPRPNQSSLPHHTSLSKLRVTDAAVMSERDQRKFT